MDQPLSAIEYVYSPEMPVLLSRLGISLFVTTYQAQKLLVFSPRAAKLHMLMRTFPRPTGLSLQGDKMLLLSRFQLIQFERVFGVTDLKGTAEPYDFCFSPRISYICGDVLGHEIALIRDTPHFVNTRFNCLAIPSIKFSFEQTWRPKFITSLVPEDRCHLNGFAIDGDDTRYLTCLAIADVKDGWRAHKRSGGVIIDYHNSEVVADGLSMPHSPRLYQQKLWVLNSGKGQLEQVDTRSGKCTVVTRLPGFLRGLAFCGPYAFIGLSRIRESQVFGALEISEHTATLECAVYCIDLKNGALAGCVKFTKGVEELFDVQILAGSTNPSVVGFEDNTIDGLFALPPDPKA